MPLGGDQPGAEPILQVNLSQGQQGGGAQRLGGGQPVGQLPGVALAEGLLEAVAQGVYLAFQRQRVQSLSAVAAHGSISCSQMSRISRPVALFFDCNRRGAPLPRY